MVIYVVSTTEAMEKIPVAGPWITEKEIDYVTDSVRHAWYSNSNEYHERFERAFAEYVGTEYAIALPSCTSAIHLSLLALGIGPGDEVVVPELTWIASAAPVTYVGATPVFADVDSETWTLTPESLEACITPRTRAAIVVDLYGSMPAMDELHAIASRHGITIIEDAAEAIGSEYRGHRAGSLGTIGVFSFHGSKTLTTGEGGMLVTNHEDLYARALVLRDHGRRPGSPMFFNDEVGYKYKMSSMQAALGLAQLERIDELVKRKRATFSCYRRNLEGVPGLTLNAQPLEVKNSYWMVTLIVDPLYGFQKDRLMEELADRSIDTRPIFYPLSSLPAYAGAASAQNARARNRISYELSPYGVNLPSALTITEEEIGYTCDSLLSILGTEA